MSLETLQKQEQKPSIQSLTKSLYSEWEVDTNIQNSINILIRKGYLSKDLYSPLIEKISDDELAVLSELKERAGAEGLEVATHSKMETKKELTRDEILEVRQPFDEIIGQAADTVGYGALQEIFGLVRKELKLIEPEQTPTIKYQDLLDGFKELSTQLQGDSQAFTFSFISELYKSKDILKQLDSEQIVEFFNSFGL
jgi:hypothetical protein